MKLKIINTLTQQESTFEVEDQGGPLYYKFDITLDNQPEGEYQYFLIGDKTISQGLLQIGNYTKKVDSYNKETKYKEYER